MDRTPIDYDVVKSVIDSFNLPDFGKATIREIVAITNKIETLTGQRFVRMEMGVPGLDAVQIGVEAEIDALKKGVASKYPMLDGLPALKTEASRFIKAFIDADVSPTGCVPVVGSMQGTYASFLVAGQCDKKKDTILFIDPGFPVQKQQLVVLGYKYESFDAFDCRGEKLVEKVESFLKKGNIAAIIYSNPNNPSWICLQDFELEGIGHLATKYDAIVMEDLAYFAMDFRKNLSKPFEPPFQASVSKYTDNYILLISSSKAFSYAGQRIGIVAISDSLYNRKYKDLEERYNVSEFGNVFVNRVLYSLSSGTCHSAQYALAAMFKAANDGKLDFLGQVKVYADRAEKVKKMFIENGFEIVYAYDLNEQIGDGFYFTIRYPSMTGATLMEELIYYGISAISLETTGSHQEGLRVCTSFIQDNQYEDLAYRIQSFAKNHPL
jgi:aspartate/methionine/tyrosine aminotransferase